jgi:hypothetical protein
VLERLRERLSPRGLLMFEALFSDHHAVEQVCEQFDMTANAVYSFRNRLQSLVAEIHAELHGRTSDVRARKAAKPVAAELSADSLPSRSVS